MHIRGEAMKNPKNQNIVCVQRPILVDTSIAGQIRLIQESADGSRGPEEITIHHHFAKELSDAIISAFQSVQKNGEK